MDAATFLDERREALSTELSRLGSDKYLLAATRATLETESVLRVAAMDAASGRDTFERWADDASGTVADAFAGAAATEADHYDWIVADLDVEPGHDGDRALHVTMQRQDDTIDRIAAGLVGRGLVRERTGLQFVNFFINEGDRNRADRFREIRSSADEQAETGAELLAERCETDADRVRAAEAVDEVVQAAYDEYAETLGELGVDPKPVC